MGSEQSEVDQFVEVSLSEGELEDDHRQNFVRFKGDYDLDDEVLYGSNGDTNSYLARPAQLRNECLELVRYECEG